MLGIAATIWRMSNRPGCLKLFSLPFVKPLYTVKKHLLYTLIGGTILFFWQFLSHAALNLHADAQQYTQVQSEILDAIAAAGL